MKYVPGMLLKLRDSKGNYRARVEVVHGNTLFFYDHPEVPYDALNFVPDLADPITEAFVRAQGTYFILQRGSTHEGYSVHSLHDTLEGAQNEPRNEFSHQDWLIEEVPVNGKPRKAWLLDNQEWVRHVLP